MTESGLPTSEHLEHLDTDTIADLIENLLPAAEAHRAREHVKACPDCQQTFDALHQLTEDLADEGRADIPIPTDVAEHLDAVIVSESVLRSSTVGVHSLAQLREEPHRHIPKLVLAAAGVLVIGAVGVGVLLSTADQDGGATTKVQETQPADSTPALTTAEVGPAVQKWLEYSKGSVMHGSLGERECARVFASGRPNPEIRLVQPAEVDGKRSTVIGLQGGTPQEIQITVVTGCSEPNGVASPFYDTSVTLRSR